MERSVIWDKLTSDYAALHPGYKAAAGFAPVTDTGATVSASMRFD
jgi:hypothetical protein